MKKSLFLVVLAMALTAGLSALPRATQWDWPLVPIHQSFNVGEPGVADTDVGGVGHYWKYTDPLEADLSVAGAEAEKAKAKSSKTAETTPATATNKS